MSKREKRRSRRHGTTLCEAVFACSFATTVMATVGTEVLRQRLELSSARGEARARSAMSSAHDGLRAGVLAPPDKGAPKVIAESRGLTLTVERGTYPAGSHLETAPGLAPVVIRATWRDFDRKARSRELTMLVDTTYLRETTVDEGWNK